MHVVRRDEAHAPSELNARGWAPFSGRRADRFVEQVLERWTDTLVSDRSEVGQVIGDDVDPRLLRLGPRDCSEHGRVAHGAILSLSQYPVDHGLRKLVVDHDRAHGRFEGP